MSNLNDDIRADLLAAHLTAAIRHGSVDDVPPGQVPLHDRLLFALLRSGIAATPGPGTADYARRLAFDQAKELSTPRNARRGSDDRAVAA